MTTLKLNLQSGYPIEAEAISPDHFIGKTAAEIGCFPILVGKDTCDLGEVFSVAGDGSDEIILEGDLSRVKWIGAGMTQGQMMVHGDAGMHLGSGMRGGQIAVHGNAGDWAGAEMTGGKIHIHGDAGHGLGGAYRGSRHGMNRGLIIVDGSAKNETGAVMRRGLIAVMGSVAEFAGAFMLAGTILVFGRIGDRAGAGMKYGSIVAFDLPPNLLPTFHYDCVYQPPYLKMILRSLKAQGCTIDEKWLSGNYLRYSGDTNSLGKGEILVYDQR
jgi:formylmethanofuran dehydrogenase subunit C